MLLILSPKVQVLGLYLMYFCNMYLSGGREQSCQEVGKTWEDDPPHSYHSLQISFIRRRDFHILTNGHNVYTRDERIEIFHAAKSHDWYLVIKRANHNDSGIYECQVHTSQCFKITEKVSFFIAREASYIYISSVQKFIKNQFSKYSHWRRLRRLVRGLRR